MRSTSSRRSAVALLLCGSLLWRPAPPASAEEVASTREPALLLKFAAPDLDDRSARRLLDPIPAVIAKKLRVRWLPVPVEPSGEKTVPGELPVPDDAALRRIAGKVSRASERMDKGGTAAASLLLDDAEGGGRALRPEFSPDPALFPPQFLSGWEAARRHAVP